MNPMLKKISSANFSGEIADLLQKHIGEGANQSHCKDACEAAAQRIKNEKNKQTIQAIIAFFNNSNWCETAQVIINMLRNSVEDQPIGKTNGQENLIRCSSSQPKR